MRILVTGATGFIGSTLLPRLRAAHPEASVLCIGRGGLNRNIIQEFNPEYVIHLAACNTSLENEEVIDPLIDANIKFGVRLLEMVSSLPSLKLFINTGSFSQYTPVGDAYLYSATKSAFEVFLRYFSHAHGLKYITAVPYSVYGGKTTVKRVFDYIAESMDATEPVKMTPGMQQLDFVHVDDIADFYIAAIENATQLTSGEVFHLGTGVTTTLREVAEKFEEVSGRKCNISWGARPYRDTDIMYACAPGQDSRDKIWHPKIELESGVRNFLSSEKRL